MGHVGAHDELRQVVHRLLKRGDPVLDLDRAFQSLDSVVEVVVDALLVDSGLISSLVCGACGLVVGCLYR